MPAYEEVPPGWTGIVTRLVRMMEEIDPDVRIDQVKSKYGGLRVYASPSNAVGIDACDATQRLIEQAEVEAALTCEECSEPGSLASRGGWFKTLCDAHALEFGYSRKASDGSQKEGR